METPIDRRRIKEVFSEAAELRGDARERYLAESCEGDAGLRAEVESLLREADADTGSLFPTLYPAPNAGSLSSGERQPPPDRERIGPYRLLEQIGQGGMGLVYLALRDDDHFKKRVALKVLRSDISSDRLQERFLQERQILAGLEHDSIARLLDGGSTEEGLPYLVMEYVEGKPIDRYCDENLLSVADRVRLFIEVCDAVQYAHQNLVVHRDLKPSNILVSANGSPKLLDFGIAKLINPELARMPVDPTRFDQRFFSPYYASPEQVRGENITTASDIYSLGALLYELLSGHRPYRTEGDLEHEVMRAICEEEPSRPSTSVTRVEERRRGDSQIRVTPEEISRTRKSGIEALRRRLEGDLDNIVLMALRKEPQRRYDTVRGLASDLRHHLSGHPVMAHGGSFTYNFAKFVRRNKARVAVASAALLGLVGAIVLLSWQGHQVELERQKSQQRFDDVRQMANSFIFVFDEAIQNLPGSLPARRLIVAKALEYLNSLAAEEADDPSLRLEIANAYMRTADIQWNRYYSNIGDPNGARQSLLRAIELQQAVLTETGALSAVESDLAQSRMLLGDVEFNLGRIQPALQLYYSSRDLQIELAQRARNEGRDAAREERALAISYQRLGDALGNPRFSSSPSDRAAALEAYEKMQAIFRQQLDADPSSRDARFSLSIGYEKIGDMERGAERWAKALAQYESARDVRQALAEAEPTNSRIARDVGVAMAKCSDMREQLGELSEAIAAFEQALAIFERNAVAAPDDSRAQKDMSWGLERLNQLAFHNDQSEAQINYGRRLLQHQRRLSQRTDANPDTHYLYARSLLEVYPASLRQPELAVLHARIAAEEGGEPYHLELLANAYFANGEPQRASEQAMRAASLLEPEDPYRAELESAAQEYASGGVAPKS